MQQYTIDCHEIKMHINCKPKYFEMFNGLISLTTSFLIASLPKIMIYFERSIISKCKNLSLYHITYLCALPLTFAYFYSECKTTSRKTKGINDDQFRLSESNRAIKTMFDYDNGFLIAPENRHSIDHRYFE